jgi:hypothetical protein
MANGYRANNYELQGSSATVLASQTKQPVSKAFIVSAADSKTLRARIKVSGVTVTNSITAILQSSPDNVNWEDHGTVAITTNGSFDIYHFADDTEKTLWPLGRIAITTGVADVAVVDSIIVARQL